MNEWKNEYLPQIIYISGLSKFINCSVSSDKIQINLSLTSPAIYLKSRQFKFEMLKHII